MNAKEARDENFRNRGRIDKDGNIRDENFRNRGRIDKDGNTRDENFRDRGRNNIIDLLNLDKDEE